MGATEGSRVGRVEGKVVGAEEGRLEESKWEMTKERLLGKTRGDKMGGRLGD
jgi:hypothetical protein